MRYDKIFALVLVCGLLINLTACEAFKRKFIPKKKPEEKRAVLYHEEEYIKAPNTELYKKHYLFWKSWQDELALALNGGNHLKQISCAESAVAELKIMSSYLIEDKEKELEPELTQLIAIRDKIKKRKLTLATASRLRRDTDRQKIRIEKRFVFSKIEDYIK